MQVLVCILLLSLMQYCSPEKTLDDNVVLANNKMHNETSNKWWSPYPSTLNLSLEISSIINFNKFLQNMKSGLLLDNTDENVLLKSDEELTLMKKVWIYDARDSNVASMMVKMGLFAPSCFRRAGDVLIELRADQRDYLVTIFLKKSKGIFTPLRFPYCSTPCSIGRFELQTRDLIPDEWNYECIERIGDILLLVMWLVSLVTYLWFMRELSRNRPRNDEPRRISVHNASIDAVIEVIDERYQ